MTTTKQRIEALERGRGGSRHLSGVVVCDYLSGQTAEQAVAERMATGRFTSAGCLVVPRPMSREEWEPLVVAGQQRLLQRAEHYAQHGVDPIPDPPPFG